MFEWFDMDTMILILFIVLLLIGLFFCLKHKVMVLFTFLLLFLFSKLINIYFLRYTRLMKAGEIPKPENVDIDKLLSVVEQSTQFIELIGLIILIIGLYKLGRSKQHVA